MSTSDRVHRRLLVGELEPRTAPTVLLPGETHPFDDGDGDHVAVKFTGTGQAEILSSGADPQDSDITDINFSATSAKSALTITVIPVIGGGTFTAGAVTGQAGQAFKQICVKLNGADLVTTDIVMPGGLSILKVLGGGLTNVTLTTSGIVKQIAVGGNVVGAALDIAGACAKIALSASVTGSTLQMQSLGQAIIKGDFNGSTLESAGGEIVNKVQVHGNVDAGSVFTFGGDVKNLTCKGAMGGEVECGGLLGSLRVTGMLSANVFTGSIGKASVGAMDGVAMLAEAGGIARLNVAQGISGSLISALTDILQISLKTGSIIQSQIVAGVNLGADRAIGADDVAGAGLVEKVYAKKGHMVDVDIVAGVAVGADGVYDVSVDIGDNQLGAGGTIGVVKTRYFSHDVTIATAQNITPSIDLESETLNLSHANPGLDGHLETLVLPSPASPPVADVGGGAGLFAGVNDFGYQLQPGPDEADFDLDAIGQTAYDVIVIEPYHDCVTMFSPAEVAALQASAGGPKLVLAYVSIGEAEDYRAYWDTMPKDLIVSENSNWQGNYKVRYWDARWQQIILDVIDDVIDAGFDGVYLDIVDAFQELGPEEVGGDNTDRMGAEHMIDFVSTIAYHARVDRGDADFLIVPQNATDIINAEAFPEDVCHAGRTPAQEAAFQSARYFTVINAVGAEDTFFYSDRPINNPPYNPQNDVIANLAVFQAAGKPVFAIDYVTVQDNIDTFYAEALAHGYIPYASVRDLDRLVINPGHEPD